MLNINFTPFPDLVSERLHLRRISAEDAAVIFAMRSSAEMMKYIPRPLYTQHDEARAYVTRADNMIAANEGIEWAITLKGNKQMIGTAGLYRLKPHHHRSELGYMLLPEYRGKGIATEVVKLMLDFRFDQLNLHSMEAVIDPGNIASERVLQKNGFIKEAHIKENEFFNGEYIDTVIYSLLKRNYKR